jgi:hypothetical protein
MLDLQISQLLLFPILELLLLLLPRALFVRGTAEKGSTRHDGSVIYATQRMDI